MKSRPKKAKPKPKKAPPKPKPLLRWRRSAKVYQPWKSQCGFYVVRSAFRGCPKRCYWGQVKSGKIWQDTERCYWGQVKSGKIWQDTDGIFYRTAAEAKAACERFARMVPEIAAIIACKPKWFRCVSAGDAISTSLVKTTLLPNLQWECATYWSDRLPRKRQTK